jgi:hypothetical protein
MFSRFRLFWLRETGCDAGTPLRADELERSLLPKILPLAGDSPQIDLRLPYLNHREWRRRDKIFGSLTFERHGSLIAPVLSPSQALRDTAASLALTHPVWIDAAGAGDPRHFRVWQRVSMAVQRFLRDGIAEQYFRDSSRFEDRELAFPMLCYQAARICHGRPRSEFTYDLRDYPHCPTTLAQAFKLSGLALQELLARIEQRLLAEGMPELSRRYRPVWYQDIIVAVRRAPEVFIELLAAESAYIHALIELGVNKTPGGVHGFSKAADPALRKVYGMDLRPLGLRALEETTRILESAALPSGEPQAIDDLIA